MEWNACDCDSDGKNVRSTVDSISMKYNMIVFSRHRRYMNGLMAAVSLWETATILKRREGVVSSSMRRFGSGGGSTDCVMYVYVCMKYERFLR